MARKATAALDELREITHGIHSSVLTTGGLRPALRTLARRAPLPVELHVHVDARLPEPVETGAYYTVAEALTNTAKYAHASTVTITVDTTTDTDTTVLRLRPPGEGTTLHAQIPLTTAHSTGLTFLPPPDGKADLHAPPSSPRPTTEA